MSFYITRALESGPIRFGVGERKSDPAEGDDAPGSFSTGPEGEYERRGSGGTFLADAPLGEEGEVGALALASRTPDPFVPWWGWVSIGFGLLLILLGLLVVLNKGYWSGWVEAAVGVMLAALPFAITMKKRRERRIERERERAEREGREARLKETAGTFIERARAIRSVDDAELLAAAREAREGKEIPYESIAGPGREAAARAGFDALLRWKRGGRGVAEAIDRVADAVGLDEEDLRRVREAVVQRPWWHLLADDRMSPEARGRLEELRGALRLGPDRIAIERSATDELERLRGVAPTSLPKLEPPSKLRPLEFCVHRSRAMLTEPKIRRVRDRDGVRRRREEWKEGTVQDLTITNQRLLVREGRSLEIDLRRIWDLEVDADRSILTLLEGGDEKKKRTHYLRMHDPIYTAGVIQAAAASPLKPKGLV
ncbi:MAG TPA: hypothetical protein VMS56_02325 [Thermoanaerobaculia bacterium]|nr:hypothetical protein [Thermoanaerobaculia bacterium]